MLSLPSPDRNTTIELRHLHPCDLPRHEEGVAADALISIDVGLSPAVLVLIANHPGWLEGFLGLAKEAPEGFTCLERDGAPADLYLLRHGKHCELGTRDDFKCLWGLSDQEWDDLLLVGE
jgi:hypothetical protein